VDYIESGSDGAMENNVKKPSEEEFVADFVQQLGFPDLAGATLSFEFNIRMANQEAVGSKEMAGLLETLRSLPEKYAPGRPDLLFYPKLPAELPLLTKTFRGAANKAFRRNVLYNKRFPNPPREGLIAPAKLYEDIEDLLRTRLVCKYLDGPQFVCERLMQYCSTNGIDSHFRDLSTNSGYYAWHFYFRVPVLLSLGGKVEQRSMFVEIQLTTQLAEVLAALTHDLYAANRMAGLETQDRSWIWDANSQRFRSAYLGHGLHLFEGVIQNLKDDLIRTSSPGEPANSAPAIATRDLAPPLEDQ
jgi:hypothetical protein